MYACHHHHTFKRTYRGFRPTWVAPCCIVHLQFVLVSTLSHSLTTHTEPLTKNSDPNSSRTVPRTLAPGCASFSNSPHTFLSVQRKQDHSFATYTKQDFVKSLVARTHGVVKLSSSNIPQSFGSIFNTSNSRANTNILLASFHSHN